MARNCAMLFAVLFALSALSLFGDEPKGKRVALLIGVNKYDHVDLTKLDYAENDAEDLSSLLSNRGNFDEVRVLTATRAKKGGKAPTKANIDAELKALFKGKSRNDVILITFSGHGVQLNVSDPQGKDPEKTFSCICPSDAQLNDTDYKNGTSPTLINLDHMLAEMGACGAGAKLLLVDACRNDVKARALDTREVKVPKNVMVLFSCDSGQKAFETDKLGGKGNGVFTFHVLEALRGGARNSDGVVTWGLMDDRVRSQVPKSVDKEIGQGAKQTPHSLHSAVAPVVLIPKVPLKTVKNSLGMELVEIYDGNFEMGAPNDERGGKRHERPRHTVRITKPFYLGMTEVTQAQYLKVIEKNPSAFAADGDNAAEVKESNTADHPVENITYAHAIAFCTELSALPDEKKAKRHYRLPTEAEWEYACRAGTNTAFHTGDNLTTKQANFDGKRTFPVKKYDPNIWGLYGMHGNVREWVADWYGADYYDKSPKDDPQGPEGMRRVIRGGSWADAASDCRSAARELASPKHHDSQTGFRVVMEQR